MQNKSDKILLSLKSSLKPFNKGSNFSTEPGIYAIGFNGQQFPLDSAQSNIKQGCIIYIGKTESNQISRDVKTHFENGKSGSSTLRRSLGGILKKKLNLTPIPRGCKEKSSRHFTNYKFTSDGEEKLTKWMENNLSISFWKKKDSSVNLREIEKRIIEQACPILNLQNNPNNKWKTEIKNLRKICRDFAEENKNLYK